MLSCFGRKRRHKVCIMGKAPVTGKRLSDIAYCYLDKGTFEVVILWNSDVEVIPCQSARTLVKIQAARRNND